jgi:hypothetical protein
MPLTVEDGSNISVGYIVHEMKMIDDGTSDAEGATPTFLVTRWEPLEISLVSIPADTTVGIGRDVNDEHLERARDQQRILAFAKAERLEDQARIWLDNRLGSFSQFLAAILAQRARVARLFPDGVVR